MEITETLYVTNKTDWRKWLQKHHATKKVVWLVYYKKHTGTPRIPYDDAVEEALCFGWIDSTVKRVDDESYVQRFTPRRKKSYVSELNKERIRKMIEQNKMTKAGFAAIEHVLEDIYANTNVKVALDIKKALEKKKAWNNFKTFSTPYKKIRIGFIEIARSHPELFKTRLNYFVKMTAQNKQYGMVP
jgi:uncharacterized protein YdeI (YjbR/CyaY-like superfamily)